MLSRSRYAVLLVILLSLGVSYAVVSASFSPGETLNPDCAPTDPDCTVRVPRLPDTFVVPDIAGRDALVDIRIGDVAVVTDINETFQWTQGGVWQKFSKALLTNVYLVPNIIARDALANLQAGDVVVVTDINESFVRTQAGTWQLFSKTLLANNYVVPDLAALNALSNLQAGDTAVVTSITKSFIRTQTGTWQELLSSSSAVLIKHTYVVVDDVARDALVGIEIGDIAIVTSSNTTFIYTQNNTWQQLLTPPTSAVLSINGKTGDVLLGADDIPEGLTNRYFTTDHARAAVSATAPISYNPITGIFGLTFSAPLVLSGSSLTVDLGALLSTWVGSTNLTTLGTIGTGIWNGTPIAVAKGGTGQTSYTNGQLLIGNTTGNTLTPATLTAGSGVAIANGAGNVTVTNAAPAMIAGTSGNALTGNGRFYALMGDSAGNTTDSSAGTRTLVSRNGTIKNLHVILSVAPGVGKTNTYTIYKNGIATALAVSVSGAATSGSNLVSSISVIAGDEVSIGVIGQTNTKLGWAVDFTN